MPRTILQYQKYNPLKPLTGSVTPVPICTYVLLASSVMDVTVGAAAKNRNVETPITIKLPAVKLVAGNDIVVVPLLGAS